MRLLAAGADRGECGEHQIKVDSANGQRPRLASGVGVDDDGYPAPDLPFVVAANVAHLVDLDGRPHGQPGFRSPGEAGEPCDWLRSLRAEDQRPLSQLRVDST